MPSWTTLEERREYQRLCKRRQRDRIREKQGLVGYVSVPYIDPNDTRPHYLRKWGSEEAYTQHLMEVMKKHKKPEIVRVECDVCHAAIFESNMERHRNSRVCLDFKNRDEIARAKLQKKADKLEQEKAKEERKKKREAEKEEREKQRELEKEERRKQREAEKEERRKQKEAEKEERRKQKEAEKEERRKQKEAEREERRKKRR